MFRDAYDVLLLIAAAGFGVGSVFIGWSVLRDRGRPGDDGPSAAQEGRRASDSAVNRPHVGLELLAWAIPTVLMVLLFVAAIRAER